jgi:hypothetical protein
MHPGAESRGPTEPAEKGKQLKRGADDAELDENHSESEDEVSSDEVELTHDCNQIRRMINTFIDNGGMKVKDFMDVLNVSSVSYYRFMKQHGKDKGMSSDAYPRALRFFQKRKAKGIPMPKKRRVTAPKASSSSATGGNNGAAAGTSAASSKAAATTASAGAANIELDGELEDAVEVYDSCDEIRRKINAHLRKPDVAQAQFLRDLHAQFHGPRKPKTVSSPQLNTFRGQKGPVSGNTSCVYYAAYVFFEKERLAAGRPKTQHREDMEGAWAIDRGVDLKRILNNVHYITAAGRKPHMNKLGKVSSFF